MNRLRPEPQERGNRHSSEPSCERIDAFSAMMVIMADTPDSEPESSGARWMRDNRLAASIALGVSIGLVWGITAGVVFAVLVGYGVAGTFEVFVPGGVVIGAVVGIAVSRGARSFTGSGSQTQTP